ncbi:MAG: class I SAM-dependent methyltransferase [Planctomycetota bacterium]
MEFDQLQKTWQHLGATDPRWAILTDPNRKGGGWDDREFWLSGEQTIGWVQRELMGVQAMPKLGRALDFGCGHGRLTQALAQHFQEVVGVDVAESMVAGARAANKIGARVTFEHNAKPDLSLFPSASFDFVLTLIVLQHMQTKYSAVYLREFMRVLKPRGVAFFQIPVESLAPPPAAPRVVTGNKVSSPVALRSFTRMTPPHMNAPANQWMWVRVDVHNTGERAMASSSPGAVELGVRAESFDGSALSATTWARLPHDIAPGGGASLLVPVRAPSAPGRYDLAAMPCVDRQWCAHPESSAASMRLIVDPAHGDAMPPEPPPRPVYHAAAHKEENAIQMYWTSFADLHANITGAGGEFVEVGLDTMAGPEWVSAHCIVRKK